ncbi:fam-d protein [Plasmodium vinckei brucechwatti]|uniref:Fam-d protein n=1 Tax=Plasmodium vinckei brucechwatti TaxID=119398 RepID=A0A6V7S4C3_PLAVN|nr:fam-d protein [Plasmodium vinckei brucechwatti]
MNMLNITLLFFILLLFANIKGATFQNANNSSTKLIAYNPISQPTATFTNHKEKYTPYLNAINDALSNESEKTKYAFHGGNYHWVITDFDIYIDNDCRSVKKYFSKKEIETIQAGTIFFIDYVKGKFKDVVSRYMYKYDFEHNYPTDLMKFVHKLKASVYDRFEYELAHCLIKYEKEPNDVNLKNRANRFFEALVQNSDMKMKGHFIKITWDNENKCLTHNVSLYFNININKNNANVDYNFIFPKRETVESFVKPLRKHNLMSQA